LRSIAILVSHPPANRNIVGVIRAKVGQRGSANGKDSRKKAESISAAVSNFTRHSDHLQIDGHFWPVPLGPE
jgi:hypothetical protein